MSRRKCSGESSSWLPLLSVIDLPSPSIPVRLSGARERGFENERKLLVIFFTRSKLTAATGSLITQYHNRKTNGIIFPDKIVTSCATAVSGEYIYFHKAWIRFHNVSLNRFNSQFFFTSFFAARSSSRELSRCRHLILYFNLKHFFLFSFSESFEYCRQHTPCKDFTPAPLDCFDRHIVDIRLNFLFTMGSRQGWKGLNFIERNELFSSYLMKKKLWSVKYLLLLEREEWRKEKRRKLSRRHGNLISSHERDHTMLETRERELIRNINRNLFNFS